ncbi:hypothetical protein MKS82_02815 [Ochrobactrum sp. A-1]|nr:hypothetical protein [Ochrobactrum sp. A-1]
MSIAQPPSPARQRYSERQGFSLEADAVCEARSSWLHEDDRGGRFEIKADAVSGPEMSQTAFAAQETVQKPTEICGERVTF